MKIEGFLFYLPGLSARTHLVSKTHQAIFNLRIRVEVVVICLSSLGSVKKDVFGSLQLFLCLFSSASRLLLPLLC